MSGSSIGAEVWLAVGYGGFLLLAAFALDLSARRTAAKSARWRSGAFTYHADHDAWVCPEDQWLWPQSFDPDNRVMRYRANPSVCNACPVKSTCTSSDHGRQVSRNVDPWPSSEAERFHRGIACTVAVLAVIWPLLSVLGDRTAVERLVLAAAVVVIAAAGWPLWSHLRRTPAAFPVHVKVQGLDESLAAAAADSAARARKRTTYASDRRAPGGDAGAGAGDAHGAADADERPAGWSRLGGGAR